LSAVRNYLFNIFAAILNIRRPSSLFVSQGRAMPWWDGPTYHRALRYYRFKLSCLYIFILESFPPLS